MQATSVATQYIETRRSEVNGHRVDVVDVGVGSNVDRTWTELTSKEKLVHALYQYRCLRSRQIRNVGTAREALVLTRLESLVRCRSATSPIKYSRFPCKLDVTLTVSVRGIEINHAIQLVDISATGARVQAVEGLEVAELVKLTIARRVLGEGVLEWSARVVWINRGDAGIHFTSNAIDEHV